MLVSRFQEQKKCKSHIQEFLNPFLKLNLLMSGWPKQITHLNLTYLLLKRTIISCCKVGSTVRDGKNMWEVFVKSTTLTQFIISVFHLFYIRCSTLYLEITMSSMPGYVSN